MKKISIFVVLMAIMSMFVFAENVTPYDTLQLPQLEAQRDLDTDGVWRTYLYCTWQIDGVGEKAVPMTTDKCPGTVQSHTFQEDETYFVRIDYATLQYTQNNGWEVANAGKDKDMTIEYVLDIPEPEQSIFDNIISNILSTINNILCNLFGIC